MTSQTNTPSQTRNQNRNQEPIEPTLIAVYLNGGTWTSPNDYTLATGPNAGRWINGKKETTK